MERGSSAAQDAERGSSAVQLISSSVERGASGAMSPSRQRGSSAVQPATPVAGEDLKASQASILDEDCLGSADANRKMVWGLYAVYAAIGTVNGFFATYLNTPTICQGIFGPIGQGVTIDQCNVAGSIFQISWNFKIFLGFLLDNCSFFGSRRKGWILFGWTGGLVMLAFNAIMVETFIKDQRFDTYLYSLMAMCCFYTFSDVAGDGLIIEVSKFETEDQRGQILTTCQMVRFTALSCVSAFGLVFMSGPSYQAGTSEGAVVLSFELPFSVIHWCLLAFALPSYVVMWIYLKDPPVAEDDAHGVRGFAGVGIALGRCWQAVQSYAIFMLLVQALGLLSLAQLQNPALQLVALVANPSSFQNGLGATIGSIGFVIGVWLFRKFLIKKNWRITLVFTYGALACVNVFAIMIINNAGGFSQNGWFYMGQTALPSIIQGLSQVLSCLAVIEISPPGLEATIYELLISAQNGALALMVALQTNLGPLFNLGETDGASWADNHCSSNNGTWGDNPVQPFCHDSERNMTNATIMTIVVNIVAIFIFVWFMPKNAAHCREWAAKVSWQNGYVGVMNLLIFVVPFVYANVSLFLDISASPTTTTTTTSR